MRLIVLAMASLAVLATTSLAALAAAPKSNADLEALKVYEGTWRVMRKDGHSDTLINRCTVLGQYFTCAQNVNGEPGNLVVFLRHGEAGHYLTQNVTPEGRATGLTDLEIQAGTWTYSSRQNENGRITYYKTINAFSGTNKIHFESSHSSNGRDFTVDASGDETRVAR